MTTPTITPEERERALSLFHAMLAPDPRSPVSILRKWHEALSATEARERELIVHVQRLRKLLSTACEAKHGTARAHDGEELFGFVIDHHVYNQCGAIIGSILYPQKTDAERKMMNECIDRDRVIAEREARAALNEEKE